MARKPLGPRYGWGLDTYVDVPHEVCGGQRELDVLSEGELLPYPPCGEDCGGLGVLRRAADV